MKVMVTGGSGFIGSHLVEKLIDKGIKVRIYDLQSPDFLEELPEDKKKMVDYYQGSLLEQDRLRIASSGSDYIFHLAAVANVNDVEREPRYAFDINMTGTFNVLEAARNNPGIKRVIFASTVWSYQCTPQIGDEELQEDAPLALPSHFYTATKIAGEAMCKSYSDLYDVNYTILRFGVPYGVRARGAIVTAIFVHRALTGQAITIAGDGSQYRKFVNVEDLAEGCVLSLSEKARNKIYNLEGEEMVSIKDIADAVDELIGNVEIIYTEGRKGDFKGKDISNKAAKADLGWEPKISFKEGLGRYIDWYKKVLSQAQADEKAVALV